MFYIAEAFALTSNLLIVCELTAARKMTNWWNSVGIGFAEFIKVIDSFKNNLIGFKCKLPLSEGFKAKKKSISDEFEPNYPSALFFFGWWFDYEKEIRSWLLLIRARFFPRKEDKAKRRSERHFYSGGLMRNQLGGFWEEILEINIFSGNTRKARDASENANLKT